MTNRSPFLVAMGSALFVDLPLRKRNVGVGEGRKNAADLLRVVGVQVKLTDVHTHIHGKSVDHEFKLGIVFLYFPESCGGFWPYDRETIVYS